MSNLVDSFHRRINYMRISVTDRCDLRCVYCTAPTFHNLSHDDILRYEEIERVVQAAASLGVTKIRLTGGEPLVRLHLNQLVGMLVGIAGIEEISLTTNGTLLAKYAAELKSAGLQRVNVSLDSLKTEKFARITGSDKLEDVLAGIQVANNVGLTPVKINMVALKGVNDDEIPDFVRKTITDGWHVRFIEHMPFAESLTQGHGLLPIGEIMAGIQNQFGKLQPYHPSAGNGPAKYYKLPGATGTLGFIGAVTECFCAQCNRFRLTADGKLRPCLLDDDEIDIKTPLRRGTSIEELAGIIRSAAVLKRKQHNLKNGNVPSARSMRHIGG
ncbi:MAG: GTP 3',8-cyclase MoaA [Dehalococcoidales bacterium]|nr:GTP 3',8-cyclase MoaA [Dehalococcoidales bacterium]